MILLVPPAGSIHQFEHQRAKSLQFEKESINIGMGKQAGIGKVGVSMH